MNEGEFLYRRENKLKPQDYRVNRESYPVQLVFADEEAAVNAVYDLSSMHVRQRGNSIVIDMALPAGFERALNLHPQEVRGTYRATLRQNFEIWNHVDAELARYNGGVTFSTELDAQIAKKSADLAIDSFSRQRFNQVGDTVYAPEMSERELTRRLLYLYAGIGSSFNEEEVANLQNEILALGVHRPQPVREVFTRTEGMLPAHSRLRRGLLHTAGAAVDRLMFVKQPRISQALDLADFMQLRLDQSSYSSADLAGVRALIKNAITKKLHAAVMQGDTAAAANIYSAAINHASRYDDADQEMLAQAHEEQSARINKFVRTQDGVDMTFVVEKTGIPATGFDDHDRYDTPFAVASSQPVLYCFTVNGFKGGLTDKQVLTRIASLLRTDERTLLSGFAA